MCILVETEAWDFSICQISSILVMWCHYTANIHNRTVADGVFKIELANSVVSLEVH